MGLSLVMDESIGMCRSVGDWPNGVVLLDMSDPCDPSLAVDWCYPVKPIEEMEKKIDEQGEPYLEIEAPPIPKDDHMERISSEEAIVACQGINEAMAIWQMVCSVIADLAKAAGTDPEAAHVFFHMYKFSVVLFTALTNEAEHRGPDGRRIDD